ncbi:transcriptional regulator [Actinoallomurus sp. NPDC052308]|uniref:helix-turn-helix transcriptional regulator n=1 Tax=Actinoallomurus sp. NPDC052308 TaxID=3155530 RepID=UPI00343257F2
MDDVDAIAALQDPVRRRLYEYVAAQDHEVGRAEAADAAGIQRTLAAFHLDRLTEAGLLEAVFRRPAGRTGPGAGRPAKLYRRSVTERVVSVPPRDYRAVAELLAAAVEEAGGEEILERLARSRGRSAGAAVAGPSGDPGTRSSGGGSVRPPEVPTVEPPADATVRPPEDDVAAGERVAAALRARGYEPYREGGEVRLRNCPFHALAVEFPPLVCGMNLALLEGLLEGLEPTGMVARMDPRPGECCVVLASKNNDS